MKVLCANSCGWGFRELFKAHRERVGWLMGPSTYKTPWPNLHYALDNDAFSAWSNDKPWDHNAWVTFLVKISRLPNGPMWALCPDVVADREKTIANWPKFSPFLRSFGWPVAFAVQDGMLMDDVPDDADLIFVGGTTRWKWRMVPYWVRNFQGPVHVGRVRQERLLWCAEHGVASCDGTGWFREGQSGKPRRFLQAFLEKKIGPNPTFDFYHEVTI